MVWCGVSQLYYEHKMEKDRGSQTFSIHSDLSVSVIFSWKPQFLNSTLKCLQPLADATEYLKLEITQSPCESIVMTQDTKPRQSSGTVGIPQEMKWCELLKKRRDIFKKQIFIFLFSELIIFSKSVSTSKESMLDFFLQIPGLYYISRLPIFWVW